jgi:hypothetical protein
MNYNQVFDTNTSRKWLGHITVAATAAMKKGYSFLLFNDQVYHIGQTCNDLYITGVKRDDLKE